MTRILLIAAAAAIAVGGCSPIAPADDGAPGVDAGDPQESAPDPTPAEDAATEPEQAPSQEANATEEESDPAASPTPAAEGTAAAPGTPMTVAFAAGDSVICSYTYMGYDAETTLQSMELFRIDQDTQGGMAHTIRGPETTYVWVEGMITAMEFDTTDFDQTAEGVYPTFTPTDFDIDALFTDGTCHVVQRVDDALFELPSGMGAEPAS